jgi:hypothetical protein
VFGQGLETRIQRSIQTARLPRLTAYLKSDTFELYKPGTVKQRRSMFDVIARSPASNGRHVLGDSLLVDWLHGTDARDAVLRIMGACGEKVEAAHRRLIALNQFFTWLLGDEPQAAAARSTFRINVKTAFNPCKNVDSPKRKRTKGCTMRRGHTPFTNDQVEEWLEATKDDPEQHRAVRFLRITGARISDLHRLNRGMIKRTPHGPVLTYVPAKGDDSAFREGRPDPAVVPFIPELQALIDEVPTDRFYLHPFRIRSALPVGGQLRQPRSQMAARCRPTRGVERPRHAQSRHTLVAAQPSRSDPEHLCVEDHLRLGDR